MQIFEETDFQNLPIKPGSPESEQLRAKFEYLRDELWQFIQKNFPGIFVKKRITGWGSVRENPELPRITFSAAIGQGYRHFPQLNVEIGKERENNEDKYSYFVKVFLIFYPDRSENMSKNYLESAEKFGKIIMYYQNELLKMGQSIEAVAVIENNDLYIYFEYDNNDFIISTDNTIKKITNDFEKLIPIYKIILDNYRSNNIMEEIMTYSLLLNNKQIILTGPPGTGKTYYAKRMAAKILNIPDSEVDKEEKWDSNNEFTKARFPHKNQYGAWSIVQFHPAYNYEDFVRGIVVETPNQPSGGLPHYLTQNKILGEMAKEAKQAWEDWKAKNVQREQADLHRPDDSCPKYVLIIDEINRANLAAVLGELIYALEYRGSEVRTPYTVEGDNSLVIPPNLYIIGTMNTADRSIGHIDYAVRRRFVFKPCLPDRNALTDFYNLTPNNNTGKAADTLYQAVEALFQYPDDGCLARDFYPDDVQVGHTYFMAQNCDELAMKFAYQVYPLLREYYKDGILQPGKNDELKISLKNGDVIDIKKGESAADIYDKILNLCKQQTPSTSASGAGMPESENGADIEAPAEDKHDEGAAAQKAADDAQDAAGKE